MVREPLVLPPKEVTNQQLYALIEQLHTMLHEQTERIDDTTGELAKLRKEADEARLAQKAEIDKVLEPWRAARYLDKSLKYVAGLVILMGSAGAVLYGLWNAVFGGAKG